VRGTEDEVGEEQERKAVVEGIGGKMALQRVCVCGYNMELKGKDAVFLG
jgi:hypothetical protein